MRPSPADRIGEGLYGAIEIACLQTRKPSRVQARGAIVTLFSFEGFQG